MRGGITLCGAGACAATSDAVVERVVRLREDLEAIDLRPLCSSFYNRDSKTDLNIKNINSQTRRCSHVVSADIVR